MLRLSFLKGVMAFGDLVCVPNGSNTGVATEEEEEHGENGEDNDVIGEEPSLLLADFNPSAPEEYYQILMEEEDEESRKIDVAVLRPTNERGRK